MEEIQNWLVLELGVSRTSIIHSGVAWHYRQYGTLQVSRIASFLYDEAQVYLDRKYQLAQQIIHKVQGSLYASGVANEASTMPTSMLASD